MRQGKRKITLKPNDVLIWEGDDGILKHGHEYCVWQIRDGVRGQEFTLKHKDLQMVEPIIWWEVGALFARKINLRSS